MPVSVHDNLHRLPSDFQLVMGAAFFGMYQHAGVLRAIARVGLHDRINEICGLSSGAIAGALYNCLGSAETTKCLLNLSLVDFLDGSASKLWHEGALCAGESVERKRAADTSRRGCTRLKNVPGPDLTVAVFDGFQGKTVWHSQSPLGQTVARSAALPVLFASDGFLDGAGSTTTVSPRFSPEGEPCPCASTPASSLIDESEKLFWWWLMQPAIAVDADERAPPYAPIAPPLRHRSIP